jgi:hypothetical protein
MLCLYRKIATLFFYRDQSDEPDVPAGPDGHLQHWPDMDSAFHPAAILRATC